MIMHSQVRKIEYNHYLVCVEPYIVFLLVVTQSYTCILLSLIVSHPPTIPDNDHQMIIMQCILMCCLRNLGHVRETTTVRY